MMCPPGKRQHPTTTQLLQNLFADKQVLKLLSRQFEIDKSLSSLKQLLVLPKAKLEQTNELNAVKDALFVALNAINLDCKLALMTGISILELTLVVVILELTEVYADEPLFNFDLIYNAYLKFLVKKNSSQPKHERQVVLKVILILHIVVVCFFFLSRIYFD